MQDPSSLQLTDKELQIWIAQAEKLEPEGLVLILTSRWQIPGWETNRHYSLPKPVYGDFIAFVRSLNFPFGFWEEPKKLSRVYDALGGNFKAVEFFAAGIGDTTSEEKDSFLKQLSSANEETQTYAAIKKVLEHRNEDEKNLLHRLLTYLVPVPREGVKKIAPAGFDPEECLKKLVGVSLVECYEDPEYQTYLYAVSPIVREYLEKNGAETPEAELLEKAATYLFWLFTHERNTRSMILAVHQALSRANLKEATQRFTLNCIVGSLERSGLYKLLLEEWLLPLQESSFPQIRGEVLNAIGKQYFFLGEYEKALEYLLESLKITQKIGDRKGEGVTLNNISQIYDAWGDYEKALEYLLESLKIRQKICDRSGEGTTLNNIGSIYQLQGNYEKALEYLLESLKIRQEIGDRSGEGTTLNNIGSIYKAQGNYEKALEYLLESLKIQQEIGDRKGEGATLNNIGSIYKAQGNYEKALEYLLESLKITQEIGDRSGEGGALNNIGSIYQAQGNYEKALEYLLESLKIRQEIGDRKGEGATLNNISQIYKARGNYEKALEYLLKALKIQQEIGDRKGEGVTLNNISRIYDARGDYEKALEYLLESLKIQQEIGDRKGEGVTLNNISRIYKERREN